MTDETAAHAALDAAIKAHAEGYVRDGEVITRWLVLAATLSFDGGGVVITMVDDETVPRWQIRGLLHEGLAIVESDGEDDQPD
jgi:hypothetical protein